MYDKIVLKTKRAIPVRVSQSYCPPQGERSEAKWIWTSDKSKYYSISSPLDRVASLSFDKTEVTVEEELQKLPKIPTGNFEKFMVNHIQKYLGNFDESED